MSSKLKSSFQKIQETASKAFAGREWAITINKDGINIVDDLDELAEEADAEEAAEVLEDASGSDE